MKLLIDITTLLNAIGAVQGVTLAFLFWRKEKNRYANRILSMLLLAFSIIVFNTVIILSGYISSIPFYQDISNVCLLLITPLIYFYVLTLSGIRVLTKSLLFHGVPFLIYAAFLLFFYAASGIESNAKENIDNLAFGVLNIQIIVYLYMSIKLISSHDTRLMESHSNMNRIGLGWIKGILISFAVAYIIHACLLFAIVSGVAIPDYIKLNVTLVWAIHIFIIAYKSASHRNSNEIEFIPKYKSSTLSTGQSKDYLKNIESVMIEQKLFLKPTLTIGELAQILGMQSRHISQVINQELGRNFYDYINAYRIEAVKERLLDPELSNLTILGIAKECGFQSGSAFNTAFKKHTGTSPSAYKKRLSLSKSA